MSSHLHLAWQEGPELSSSWQSQRGITSLMLACRLSNLAPNFQASKQVRELLAAKADPAAKAESKLTALHMAAESLPPQIQHHPIPLGDSHTLADSHTPVSSRPHPLPSAVGYPDVVQQLVDVLDANEIDHMLTDGKTALMLACKIGNPMTAKVLLGANADPLLREAPVPTADGFSSIMHAALFGHVECIATVLRNAGQNLDRAAQRDLHHKLLHAHNGNQFTALHLASLHGQRRVVQLLLRERAEVDSANAKGETPLHVSSKNGHAQVVCALLASGAAVNQVDTIGRTALHHCCVTAGGKDVADALMEVGAERDLLDEEQNTPLHLACKTGNHLTADSLLKYKVGESAPSPAFQSPLRPNSHPNSPGSSSYAIGGHHTAQ